MKTRDSLFNSLQEWEGIKKDVKKIILDLSKASIEVRELLSIAELSEGIMGTTQSKNVHHEEVKELDLLANQAFLKYIGKNSCVQSIISEENQFTIFNNSGGKYLVAIDPLDGSSNIDVNNSVGTIFGIYSKTENFSGRDLIAAGYFIYGSSTNLVLSDGKKTNIYTLNPQTNEYICTKKNFISPENGTIYSVNEANDSEFDSATQRFINQCKLNPDITARYVGSLIADFHRNLIKGGVYLYPSTDKNPNGKLRLVYECNPLALIAQGSHCASISGQKNTLDSIVSSIHQKEPLIIGAKKMVNRYLALLFSSYRLKKIA